MSEPFDVQGFATYALSQLLFKDSSVEVGVRSVLRIAEHRGLTWWKLWASLQLLTLDAKTVDEEIAEVVDRDFPAEKAEHRGRLLRDAIEEYNYLRKSDDPRCRTSSALPLIKQDCDLAEIAFSQGMKGGHDIALGNTEILNRVKNRIQAFLTAVERGETPLPPRRSVEAAKPRPPG